MSFWEKFFQAFVLESSEFFVNKVLVFFSTIFYAQDFNGLFWFKLRVSVHAYQ